MFRVRDAGADENALVEKSIDLTHKVSAILGRQTWRVCHQQLFTRSRSFPEDNP